MKSRTEFSKGQCLLLEERVVADDLDDQAAKYYKSSKAPSKPLLIDFKNSRYVDLAVLINFTALFLRRKENQQETYIGISEDKRVRDFLRVWRFPEAFYDATGIRFESILVREDQHYRGEKQETYTGIGEGLEGLEFDPDWREGSPTKRNFFEFTSFFIEQPKSKETSFLPGNIPRSEGNRWNKALIRQVLNTHLAGDIQSDDVARVVIYESLSNAVRHPNATIIQTVSKFDKPEELPYIAEVPSNKTDAVQLKKLRNKGHLRIYIWDDGDSIVDTLLPIVRNKKPLRGVELPSFMYDRIHLQIRDYQKKQIQKLVVSQAENPRTDAIEEIILLSSLFPGVTRALAEKVENVEAFDQSPQSINLSTWAYKQGMGLYALTKTALDSYQGSLFIRSGHHRLIMEVAHDAFRVEFNVAYKSKITRYPESFPKFKGNLLGIMLPIKA